MKRLELSDLVATYPSIDTPGFQTLISNKKEFAELASFPSELPPKQRGMYYNHQKLFERYMSRYDDCFVIHDTGTGKTCTISALAEHYKKNRAQIDRVYILVNGKTQKDEFKRQLACICSDGSYETAESKNAKTEASQKAAITKKIKTWYTVTTYKSFTNHITNTYPNPSDNDALKEYYSGSIFFIDEIQNIRINADTEGTADRERGVVYRTFWRVFHLIERSKRIIASATPMVRNVNELGPHLNLILPLDRQIYNSYLEKIVELTGVPITEVYNVDLSSATLEQMMPFLQGRVSYVRGLMTGAVPVYGGDDPENNKVQYVHTLNDGRQVPSSLILDKSGMSSFQSEAYNRASGGVDVTGEDEEKSSGIYNDHRQAANFVFPDGSWGSAGFDKYVTKIKTNDDEIYKATPEFSEYLKVADNLRRSSIKYYKLVYRAINEPGKRYVYNNFVSGSGSIVAGICLEVYGFRLYNNRTSAFTTKLGGVRPFCSNNSGNKTLKDGIVSYAKTGIMTYANVSSTTSNAERASIFELFNSEENINGDYIKVLNVSPVGQFGINLVGVTNADIMSADWNPSDIYQSVNRVFRSTSHVGQINALKKKLISQGKSTDNLVVPVKVNLYATYYQDGGSWRETIEPIMYKAAENKDLYIRKMMRILKRSAFDCQIHKARNVRPTDVDYSQVCDYDVCNYQCADPLPTGELDTKTYDVYYVQEILDDLIDYITYFFRINTSGNVDDITKYYQVYSQGKDVKPYYIYLALDRMIKNRDLIYNGYGFASYVREDKGVFYLTRSYPRVNEGSDYASNYYSSNLIGISSTSLEETISKIDAVRVISTFHDLSNMTVGSPQFIKTINNLNVESRSQLLESVFTKSIEGKEDEVTKFILDYFKDSILVMREPVTEIKKSANVLSRKGTRGRKPSADSKKKLVRIDAIDKDFVMNDNTQWVYLHNLYTTGGKATNYAAITHFLKAEGRIRIYKTDEARWRDVNAEEAPVYNKILQIKISNKKHDLETRHPIHGIIVGNKFSIKDGSKQSTNACRDMRCIRDGMACTSYKKKELIEIMYKIGMRSPPLEMFIQQDDPVKRVSDLVGEDVSSWDRDKILFYNNWIQSGNGKASLCHYIGLYMADNNMIFTASGNAKDQIKEIIQASDTSLDSLTQNNFSTNIIQASAPPVVTLTITNPAPSLQTQGGGSSFSNYNTQPRFGTSIFNPTTSTSTTSIFNPTTSTATTSIFNPTTSTSTTSIFNPTTSIFNPTTSTATTSIFNPTTISTATTSIFNPTTISTATTSIFNPTGATFKSTGTTFKPTGATFNPTGATFKPTGNRAGFGTTDTFPFPPT